MKLYTIAFTKNGAYLQKIIEKVIYNTHCSVGYVQKFLSTRVYDELIGDEPSRIGRASLADFCQQAWNEADAILFIGATGIAVRGIAPYVAAKDKDPAVLVMDELGKFVIPLLSGHIGGANQLAEIIAKELGATCVMTTATDINNKLAIDSWAVQKGYEIAETSGIAPVSSAVLEDRKVAILAEQSEIDELKKLYTNFASYVMESEEDTIGSSQRVYNGTKDSTVENVEQLSAKEIEAKCNLTQESVQPTKLALKKLEHRIDEIMQANRAKGKKIPLIVITPLAIKQRKNLLHIVPKRYFVGMGARRDKDSEEFIAFYDQTLEELGIHPRAIYSIASIIIKKDERCIHALAEREMEYTKLHLEFHTAEQLATAERYTSHEFTPSSLVSSVTGVDNVCERAAVISAAKYFFEKEKERKNRELQNNNAQSNKAYNNKEQSNKSQSNDRPDEKKGSEQTMDLRAQHFRVHGNIIDHVFDEKLQTEEEKLQQLVQIVLPKTKNNGGTMAVARVKDF